MTLKHAPGTSAPDGSRYTTLTDGVGNLALTTLGASASQLTHAAVSQALAASTAVVAGVAAKSVQVYELVLCAATATTVQLFNGVTALTGVMSLAAGTPLVLHFTGEPHMVTSSAAALNMALGGAVQVSGYIRFIQS